MKHDYSNSPIMAFDNASNAFDTMRKRTNVKHKSKRTGKVARRHYYWIATVINGKQALLGGYNSYVEAEQLAQSKCDNDYEIIMLPTGDENKATHLYRARRFSPDGEDSSLEESMQRLRHRGKDIGIE